MGTPASDAPLPLGEQVYQRIRSDLLTGRIRPGDRVTEEWAAAHYAVSRTPIREACRRLSEEGLLAHQARRGYRVPPVDRQEIDDLYEIRRALEVASVRRAARQTVPLPSLERLRAEWQKAAPAAGEEVVYKDEAFHRELAIAGGNQQLPVMLDAVSARIRFVRVHDFLDTGRVDQTRTQHLAILDAVLDHDPDLAAALMHAHIIESQRAVVAASAQAMAACPASITDRPVRRTRRPTA